MFRSNEAALIAGLIATMFLATNGCDRTQYSSAKNGSPSAVSAAPVDRAPNSTSTEAPSSSKTPADVSLTVVKYDQLQSALRAQRGHVVVMDVWAEY
jgi:hypothetical protein